MKKLIFVISFALALSANAANKEIEKRISFATDLLASLAEGSETYSVTPNKDPKVMIKELALKEELVESDSDFEAHWTIGSEAWATDSLLWGLDNMMGGIEYVKVVLFQTLEESERTDADKIKYADAMLKVERAEQILRSIKSVKYGVAPMGAVQCGVTFQSLLIIDTENGKIHNIVMEGSGC
ncbi:hypothetical protein ACES2L_10310 [Bdellovibrio bacteriovorus]